MHISKRLCWNFFGSLAIISCLITAALAQEDEIVGTWDCGLSVDDPATGASVRANFETTYDADGTYSRDGSVSIVVAALQVDITIVMDEAGNWRVVDSTGLGETVTAIDFSTTSETPTQMEQMMLQQMRQEATAALSTEETAQILSLTATTMELQSNDGEALNCSKA
jgi:hypothetical protein